MHALSRYGKAATGDQAMTGGPRKTNGGQNGEWSDPVSSNPTREQVDALFASARERAEQWREELYVQIGRAAAILGMKESTIRYIEALAQERYSLELGRSLDRNRAYTLQDLERLWVIGQLIEQSNLKPSEAVQLFNENLSRQSALVSPLEQAIPAEHVTLSDGFVLSRICHFLLRFLDHHLTHQGVTNGTTQLVGLLFPRIEQQAIAVRDPTSIGRHLSNVLVCYRSELLKPEIDAPTSFWSDDENLLNRNTTVTFIQDDDWALSDRLSIHVAHPGRPSDLRPVLIVLRSSDGKDSALSPTILGDLQSHTLFNNLVRLITSIAVEFRPNRQSSALRFRSDGLPPILLHDQLPKLLRLFTEVALNLPHGAAMPSGFAVLLTPDNLERPARLHIAAHWNYDPKLADVAELRLGDAPEGLSGEAYRNREPTFASAPKSDPRVVYAEREGATGAIAIPLLLDRHIQPYGVLYIASTDQDHRINPERSQILLLAANILAEQLARYWIKLLRHWSEQRVLFNANNLRWLAALDLEEYNQVVEALTRLGDTWLTSMNTDKPEGTMESVTLVVIDIYQSRRLSAEMSIQLLIPLILQRLEESWKNMSTSLLTNKQVEVFGPAWFRGDHLLVSLVNLTPEEFQQVRRLIGRLLQVNQRFPLEELEEKQLRVTFQAFAAMTYMPAQQIVDRGLSIARNQERHTTRHIFAQAIEHLREVAGKMKPEQGENITVI